MTWEPSTRGPADGTDGLNALLRGELAAVNAYQRALRSAEGRATADAAEILRFASEHQRTVAALQGAVRQLGGQPSSEAATGGAFARLRDTATVRELLDGERSGLGMYEAAHGVLEGDARDLVRDELIPRQRTHITQLSAILSRVT
jgi:bacterioferritin (cytochrome b1)